MHNDNRNGTVMTENERWWQEMNGDDRKWMAITGNEGDDIMWMVIIAN